MRYVMLAGLALVGALTAGFLLRDSGPRLGARIEIVQAAAPSPIAVDPRKAYIPALVRDGLSAQVSTSSASAFQGGAVMVTVEHAQSGSVSILGRGYVLSPNGTGGLLGLVGFGAEEPPGPAALTVSVIDEAGEAVTVQRSLVVKRTAWTVDAFDIPPAPPPDPNAPPPPPPPPNENPFLPGVYAGVSARRWQPGWILPIAEPNLKPCASAPAGWLSCVSGYFGEQRSINGGPIQGHHSGTDLAAAAGTPIRATNDGTVVMSGLYLIRGNLVVIDHGAGVFSLYGHMTSRAVAVGDVVHQGDVIGGVGTTGLSTGPHLHWEMSVGGILVDGLRWLDGTQGF